MKNEDQNDHIPDEWRSVFESLRSTEPVPQERIDRILSRIEKFKEEEARSGPGRKPGPRPRWNIGLLYAAAVILMIVGGVVLFVRTYMQGASAGVSLVSSITRSGAYLNRNGQRLAIPDDVTTLEPGDVLSLPVESGGQIRLRCGVAAMVILAPSVVSFPVLDCDHNKAEIFLSTGNLVLSAHPQATKEYLLNTERAEYRLIGTEIRLGAYYNSEFLQVIDGAVKVVDKRGRVVVVHAGNGVTFDAHKDAFTAPYTLPGQVLISAKEILTEAPTVSATFGADWTEAEIRKHYGRIGTFHFTGDNLRMRGAVFNAKGRTYAHLVGRGIVPISGLAYTIKYD